MVDCRLFSNRLVSPFAATTTQAPLALQLVRFVGRQLLLFCYCFFFTPLSWFFWSLFFDSSSRSNLQLRPFSNRATRGASVTTAATAATATTVATATSVASTVATATLAATVPTRASTAATARSTAAPRTAAGNLPFPASYAIICRSRVFFGLPACPETGPGGRRIERCGDRLRLC